MEKLHFFSFLTSKGFLAFMTFSLLACQVCLLDFYFFCGGLFAGDTGNAVGEWEEHVGWERCVDGVSCLPGEFLWEIPQAAVCLPQGF